MRGYKVTAKFGPDTVKFELPIGVKQETLEEALLSARAEACRAFGIFGKLEDIGYEALKVTLTEYYED